MSADLVSFFRARLDEEGDAAEDLARGGGAWRHSGTVVSYAEDRGPEVAETTTVGYAKYIVCYDPARVLREVKAKRQVLDLLAIAERHLDETRRTAPEYRLVAAAEAPRDALLLAVQYLALPYADHPDYRPEWAPEGIA